MSGEKRVFAQIKKVLIKSDDERFVMGEVYVPLDADTHESYAEEGEIKKAAYDFLSSGRVNQTDVMHDGETQSYYAPIVESFIVRGDNDPDGFVKGSWVVAAKVYDDELWEKIKKGEINGWSLEGVGYSVKKKTTLEQITLLKGTTEKSTHDDIPSHHHGIELVFDQDGKPVPAYTSDAITNDGEYVQSHTHLVHKLTATETTLDHAHRFQIDEEE